ncbi:MAG: phosphate/phosphite/phosphonate ABC transporter substrate-binding protein [Verrucomicrobiota bacterium]
MKKSDSSFKCSVWLSCLFLATLVFGVSGCSSSKEVDERGWPKKLVFAYWVDDEVPGLRLEATTHLADYLSKELDLEVEIKKTTQYGPVIEAMRADKVDISMFGTFAYILASAKAGAECIIVRGTEAGGISYHSLLLARQDSPVNNLEDLKAMGKDLTFAFTNPASTSGHLIPRANLELEGINPERDFKELVFPGKHNATLLSVVSGKVDVGCVSENTFRKLKNLGGIDPKEVKIIWKSPPIPNGCIAVRERLPEDLKAAIREKLLNLKDGHPETWEEVKKIYTYSTAPNSYYISANDSYFDEVRVLARRIDNLDMLN